MKEKGLILVLVACLGLPQVIFGQKTVKSTIHFATDSSRLAQEHQLKLNKLLDTLPNSQIRKINIAGHTDSIAGSYYNKRLSQKRSEAVKNFVIDKGIPDSLIQQEFLGESKPVASNKTPEGRKQNRRTEILVELNKSKPIIKAEADTVQAKDTLNKTEEAKPPCKGDTTIVYSEGTHLTISKCDFLKVQDCLELEEFNTGESLRNSDLTTMNTEGEPLLTGGMFKINLCKDISVNINIPSDKCISSDSSMSLWYGLENGKWVHKDSNGVVVTKLNGNTAYGMTIGNSGSYNVDVAMTPFQVKVKAKGGLDLIEARLSYDHPPAVFRDTSTWRGNIVKLKTFCPPFTNSCTINPKLYAKAKNDQGDTLIMEYTRTNQLEKRELFGPCRMVNADPVKQILFFNVNRKVIYRKYVLWPKDFKDK